MTRIHLTIVILTLSFLSIQSAFALNPDFRLGFRFGAGGSTLRGFDKLYLNENLVLGENSVNYKFTWDLGGSMRYVFRKDYFLQGDFLTSFGGANFTEVRSRNSSIKTLNIDYYQLKFYGGRYIRPTDKLNFIVSAGPYGALLVSDGVYKTEDNYKYKAGLNKSDFGLSLLLGIDLDPIVLAFNFDYGIKNIMNAREGSTVQNKAFKLAIYYFI